jgi:hypothetical protein
MKDVEFKVSDKRMFTPDGRLRDEYQHLEDSAPEPEAAEAAPAEPPPAAAEPEKPQAGPAETSEPSAAPASEPASRSERPAPGEPSFLDLVGLLAEHTALYLGEVSLPDGQTMRDLQAAKLHLDLLDVVRAKTQGNLTREESSVLEDILYRLRMMYVEKKRQGD